MPLQEKSSPVKIPRAVWALGVVSLLMDVSSEMIHGLLPAFMTTVLMANPLVIGVVEGLAEATSLLVKVFSGAMSDRMRRRKIWAMVGYGLAAASKPFIALAGSVTLLAGARFADRVGKGLRGAPRDALITDVTPPEIRGAAFGLRQSLDTVGAVLGPMVAMGLMVLWGGDFRKVFWVAAIPAAAAVLILWLGVKEPPPPRGTTAKKIEWGLLGQMGRAYWLVVVLGALVTMARFSEAFLILAGQARGIPLAATPVILVGLNIVYALTAYPAGRWADRTDKNRPLMGGMALLAAGALTLAATDGWAGLALGVGLWGLHMGLTQGLLSALVAETAPAAWRGTAFGVFNFLSGLGMLASNVLAGGLWKWAGPRAAFITAGAFALATLAWMALTARARRGGRRGDAREHPRLERP
jgi:MFS family permease